MRAYRIQLCRTEIPNSSLCNISNTRDSVSSGYLNTDKRVENTMRSGVS